MHTRIDQVIINREIKIQVTQCLHYVSQSFHRATIEHRNEHESIQNRARCDNSRARNRENRFRIQRRTYSTRV